jgi:hypothetical protein
MRLDATWKREASAELVLGRNHSRGGRELRDELGKAAPGARQARARRGPGPKRDGREKVEDRHDMWARSVSVDEYGSSIIGGD